MKRIIKTVALLLVLVTLATHVASCGIFTPKNNDEEIDTESIVDEVVESILDDINQTPDDSMGNSSGGIDSSLGLYPLNSEYYQNNTLTNVYSLVRNELSLLYHTFIGKITLSDGEEILGIAFTDFSNPYVNESLGVVCYPAGFIFAPDEPAIPSEEFESGLEITDIENDTDSDLKFIFTDTIEPISRHVVFLNKYVKYGVDENGSIWYEEAEYVKGLCDENLGALYSYDENRFVYDPNVGDYTVITGNSLSMCIDYKELEAEVNRIIESQNYNLYSDEIETAIYVSQDALINYWQSLEQETFMGYNVNELINIAQNLDPSTCFEISPEGLIMVDIAPNPPEESTAFVKWMTGICCGIACLSSTAISAIGTAMPQFAVLRGVGGAIIGASVEITIQVILENKALREVDYRKVALAAVAGVISAYVGVFADAVIGGVVESVYTLMDGGSLGDMADSFVLGTVSGLVLASAFNIAANGVAKLVQKALPIVKKAASGFDNFAYDVLMRKFGIKGDDFTKFGEFISSKLNKRLAKKWGGYVITEEFITGLPEQDFLTTLKKNSPKFTSNAYDIFDLDGITQLTKEYYESVARKSGNYTLVLKGEALEIAQARHGKALTSIQYIAGQPQFPTFGEVIADITPNRGLNFSVLDEAYAKGIREGTIALSDEIRNYFTKKGIDPSRVTKTQITQMRKGTELSLTWHEIYDPIFGIKGVLVDSKLHNMLSHVGGRKEAELLAETMSYVSNYFQITAMAG